jgi:uncharacterized OB-fold protein
MTFTRPVPYVEETLKPFWEGLKGHQLLFMRCKECGASYWPATYCRNHDNLPFYGSMEWAPSTGHGVVVSFNITRVATSAAFKDLVPYVLALVQFDEGPILSSNIIDCAPEDVFVGMEIEVVYDDVDEIELTLPFFRPIG